MLSGGTCFQPVQSSAQLLSIAERAIAHLCGINIVVGSSEEEVKFAVKLSKYAGANWRFCLPIEAYDSISPYPIIGK